MTGRNGYTQDLAQFRFLLVQLRRAEVVNGLGRDRNFRNVDASTGAKSAQIILDYQSQIEAVDRAIADENALSDPASTAEWIKHMPQGKEGSRY
jgi:hypothetical protein